LSLSFNRVFCPYWPGIYINVFIITNIVRAVASLFCLFRRVIKPQSSNLSREYSQVSLCFPSIRHASRLISCSRPNPTSEPISVDTYVSPYMRRCYLSCARSLYIEICCTNFSDTICCLRQLLFEVYCLVFTAFCQFIINSKAIWADRYICSVDKGSMSKSDR
jgi:hypothetical protein